MRDPAHPQVVGSLDGVVGSNIKYSDHKVYISAYAGGLQIVNAENPALLKYDTAVYDYGNVVDVALQDDLVMLAADHDFVVLQRK
jgi:hypothetical protein